MTDSGHAPGPPSDPTQPDVPDWAPALDAAAPEPVLPTTPPPPVPAQAPPSDPYAVDATMRLIPTPHIAPPEPPLPATTPPASPAERRIGKYIVKGELGRGGMGAVYLAEQPGLGREVAIKELNRSADPVALKRFLQEAQVMARTSHPNLVQVHDIELMGDINYLVLELVRGRS